MSAVRAADIESRILRAIDRSDDGRLRAGELLTALAITQARLNDRLQCLKRHGILELKDGAWRRKRRAA
jgi:DNA-binding HxlR family transcriptional regulator